MRSPIAVLAILALLAGVVPAGAGTPDHVLTEAEMQQALLRAEADRQADRAALAAVLATPEAREVAATMGADPQRVAAGIAALGDEELRDLARRARALQADPVAGVDLNRNTLLTILIVLTIVYLVILIVD